jgi:hypothetical protein
MRDMTLLRMDVERTRGNAELQQARAELAALQQQHGKSQGPGTCVVGLASAERLHAKLASMGMSHATAGEGTRPQQRVQAVTV